MALAICGSNSASGRDMGLGFMASASISRLSVLDRFRRVSKRRANECDEVPAIQITERRFAAGVVAAGQFDGLEIDVTPAQFGDDVLRILRQEGQVVGGEDNQALARVAGVLVEVGGGAGGAHQGSQLVAGDRGLKAFLHVAGGLASPDHVGKICRSVIEGSYSDARFVGGTEERVTRTQAGPDDAQFGVTL